MSTVQHEAPFTPDQEHLPDQYQELTDRINRLKDAIDGDKQNVTQRTETVNNLQVSDEVTVLDANMDSLKANYDQTMQALKQSRKEAVARITNEALADAKQDLRNVRAELKNHRSDLQESEDNLNLVCDAMAHRLQGRD